MGYYGMVFQVYNLALMLTSYSLPTAVSKLVSARVASRTSTAMHTAFSVEHMTFAIIAGGIVVLQSYSLEQDSLRQIL